jgi:hypothetical protein
MPVSPRSFFLLGAALAAAVAACDVITDIAVQGADFGGATADAHCDRRYALDGGQPQSFCQEIQGTVAASQFSDDCRGHLQSTPGTGLCPREHLIAGCKLDKKTGDNSIVRDWYYDISSIIAEAGADAGPDGGPTFLQPTPRTLADVAKACADPTRYEEGAELIQP